VSGAAHQRIEISFTSPLKIVQVEEPPQILAVLSITYGRITIVDAEGNPAKVDGPITWASSDETLAEVEVDSVDSSIVTVTPVGPTGQVQITATADADLGDGVRELITVCDISLVAGEAVAGTIQPVGAPFPKP